MLKSLQIDVVAEGVELEAYLPFMGQADIQLMQGFYFDKPMPYDQFLARHTTGPNRWCLLLSLNKKSPNGLFLMTKQARYLALVLSKILSADAATKPL